MDGEPPPPGSRIARFGKEFVAERSHGGCSTHDGRERCGMISNDGACRETAGAANCRGIVWVPVDVHLARKVLGEVP